MAHWRREEVKEADEEEDELEPQASGRRALSIQSNVIEAARPAGLQLSRAESSGVQLGASWLDEPTPSEREPERTNGFRQSAVALIESVILRPPNWRARGRQISLRARLNVITITRPSLGHLFSSDMRAHELTLNGQARWPAGS